MGEYIKPVQAFKKLDVAKLLRQGVYIYSATGFGKTELIHQYFKNQKFIYIPCEHNFCDLSVIPEEYTGTVIIEDVDVIEDEELRNEIAELCKIKKLWLIIAGRSKMPSWLFDAIGLVLSVYRFNKDREPINYRLIHLSTPFSD